MRILRNQNGFAVMLTVIVVTVAILATLTLTYAYSMNRLRYHARIKETYKLINATESAGKIVKTLWDAQYALTAPTLPNVATVQANIAALPVTGCAAGQIEVPDPDNGQPFCFNYNAGEQVNIAKVKLTPLDKFLAKLVYFYEGRQPALKLEKPSFVGWLIHEETARAATVNFPGSAPDCNANPNDVACARCRDGTGITAGTGAKSACSVLTVCPNSWAECRAGGTGITQGIRVSTGSNDTY